MKVAVMQPYLFPYIGYYQLARCADVLVLYDNVNYIKGGYINRNYILQGGQRTRITLPVPGASSNKEIGELRFSEDTRKVLKTIAHVYSKAPFFADVFPLVQDVIGHACRDITAVCAEGLTTVFSYLGLKVSLERASALTYDRDLPADERLVAICRNLGSRHYVNAIGGQALYTKDRFAELDCALSFIESKAPGYQQGPHEFVPNLSMIDVLMWCPKADIVAMLDAYELV